MGKTREQLIEDVLATLNVGGGNPSAAEVEKIDLIIDDVIDGLAARDVYVVSDAGMIGPDGGDIETAAFQEISAIVAEAVAPKFDDNDPRYAALAERAADRLRIISAPPRSLAKLRIDTALIRRRYGTYNGNGGF